LVVPGGRAGYLLRWRKVECVVRPTEACVAFRRANIDPHPRPQAWHEWIDRHRAELVAIGLPPEVYLDESHWADFLQNGHLHWHESSGFEFGDLSPGQLRALHRFLEREFGTAERPPPLLRWVRVRCGVE
jgi:hypothetical protein